MSSVKLEGDLNEINEEQQNFIVSVLEKHRYKDKIATIAPVGKLGDNFGASVKRLTIENEDGKTLKMIIKAAPTNPTARELMNSTITFKNEIVMYKELFPKFTHLEEQFDIPKEERFVYPVCYGALTTEPNEVIILEDMIENGYKTKDKMVSLDIETVKLVLKSFAQFHSLSYAFKNKNQAEYNRIKEHLSLVWELMAKNDKNPLFNPIEEQVISMVDSEIAKQKIKGLITNIALNQHNLYKSDRNGKETVIIQGDAWTNNFLFKTEEGTPPSCLMIDYQLSRESNPAGDVLFMILCCTDYETRKENFNDFIDHYYSELNKALSYYGLKSQFELPRDKFDSDLRRYAKTAAGSSIFGALLTMREASESSDLKDIENKSLGEIMAKGMGMDNLKQETMERIVGRVRGIIATAIDQGLL